VLTCSYKPNGHRPSSVRRRFAYNDGIIDDANVDITVGYITVSSMDDMMAADIVT
jgi:hypothetical protein